MKWSWSLGRVAGIDVRIHATFLILLAWVFAGVFLQPPGAENAVGGILLVPTIFGIVVLHELGHALVARRFGVRTLDITLLPIGGVARIDRMPEKPVQELLVALAGPAVNIALAILLFLGLLAFGSVGGLVGGPRLLTGSFPLALFWINVSLATFNLLPAFPMDGGRALRAFLAMHMDGVRATQIAARLGQAMAIAFGALGLFFNPLLVFIALFVWLAASQEQNAARMQGAIDGVRVERVLITEIHTLAPSQPLRDAVQLVLAGFQHEFPVVDGGRLVGLLTHADLLRGLSQKGADAPVGSCMQRDPAVADASELLASALTRIQQNGGRTLPVTREGRLVGVLTTDSISELVRIQGALHAPTPSAAA
jgi:Zn-dependent protease/CBS domain-containing protein